MYWQVYLHKTAVAYEKVLVNTLLRAKHLAREGKDVFAPPCLKYFLYNDVNGEMFRNDPEALSNYGQLDDNDIWSAMKVWAQSNDKILSMLAKDMLDRNIFKVEVSNEPITAEREETLREQLSQAFGISKEETNYLFSVNTIQKDMYDVNDDRISILFKDGTTKDIAESSEILNVGLLSKKIRKYYLCYQRF
jgi:HD superfamily phosphohydrolase